MKTQLVPTKFSDLEPGDVVIGRCGRERTIACITDGPYGSSVHVTFKSGGMPWNRQLDDTALKVVRTED
ncbi:MAG: hypothetical protein ACWGQW_02580 [bacterium]